jgi:hypothetical protein
MTCEDRCQSERRCEYDGGIESMELEMCREGYRWHIGRGGVDRSGSELRTCGKRQEGALLKNNPGGTQREGVGSKRIREDGSLSS